MQNKHIIFACKYVETWAYFPWTIRLMRDGPQNWECTEGIQEKYKEYKGVASEGFGVRDKKKLMQQKREMKALKGSENIISKA